MKKRIEIEVDIEELIDNAIEKTIADGLKDDKEYLIETYDKETYNEMNIDYRNYGTMFSMNFKENLEKELEKIVKEN